jgi:hypothetical protein
LFSENRFALFDQVLGGRSSDVHAKAPKTIGREEIKMSTDELQKLNTHFPEEIRTCNGYFNHY